MWPFPPRCSNPPWKKKGDLSNAQDADKTREAHEMSKAHEAAICDYRSRKTSAGQRENPVM